jgi:hypothetical protein
MFKILSTYMLKKIYKMQHLEGSGTPVLYIGSSFKYVCRILLKLRLDIPSAMACLLAERFGDC